MSTSKWIARPVCLLSLFWMTGGCGTVSLGIETERPNILWISTEDISPDLGCYGDPEARTPNIDRLAGQGARYLNAFSVAGVCAPSRSAIITGMYPCSIGTHHMRSAGVPPAAVKCWTEHLRAAGYYCTNNAKTDYNFDPPPTAWDESSRKAHWRNRAPGQPFFAVFNITTTHESRIRTADPDFARLTQRLRPEDRHDPAKAQLPPYYPDTPETRRDWARYYDLITAMDLEVADILRQLEEDGLADDTVVFFWGDHGRGLTRAKRWLYDSGLRIPLIIRWPKKIKPGTVEDEMVSFVDFGPTLLSVAGVKIPDYIQGQAFLGPQAGVPRRYVFGARDRMDETYDIIRALRDERYKYIRNFEPEKTYAQNISYGELMPTLQVWRKLHAERKLNKTQEIFFSPTKPVEELYDIEKDPHEVNNLASSPEHQKALRSMREKLEEFMLEINDLGLVPETELRRRMRPEGMAVTAAPVASPSGGRYGRPVDVELSCATEGASIACDIGEGWKLYTKPVRIEKDTALKAKACRIGFQNSKEVRADFRITPGVQTETGRESLAHAPPGRGPDTHRPGELKKLIELRSCTDAANLTGALSDPDSAVRFWAATGLGNLREQAKGSVPALKALLADASHSVRVRAAEALWKIERSQEGLALLIESVKNDDETVRLYALHALSRIGPPAKAAVPVLQEAAKREEKYTPRVAEHALKMIEQ